MDLMHYIDIEKKNVPRWLLLIPYYIFRRSNEDLRSAVTLNLLLLRITNNNVNLGIQRFIFENGKKIWDFCNGFSWTFFRFSFFFSFLALSMDSFSDLVLWFLRHNFVWIYELFKNQIKIVLPNCPVRHSSTPKWMLFRLLLYILKMAKKYLVDRSTFLHDSS